MLPPDSNVTRQLAHERQARLKQEWKFADPTGSEVVDGRPHRPGLRLAWVLTRERPLRFAS
jgi:hypothetical protein